MLVWLNVGWIASSCLAISLLLAADLFQEYDPAFPLRLAVGLSGVAVVVSAICASAVGVVTMPGFSFVMPFRGGGPFITQQAVGYTALVCSVVGPLVYRLAVVEAAGLKVHGPLAASGCLAGIASWLLRHSIPLFDAQWRAHKAIHATATGEVLLHFALCLCTLATAAGAQYVDGLQHFGAVALMGLHLACGVLAHVVVGWMSTANYRLFAPMQGSFRTRFARGGAWLMWAVVLLLSAGVYADPLHAQRTHAIGFFGLLSVTSNLGLLAQIKVSAGNRDKSASAVARDGRFVLTLLATAAYVAIVALWPLRHGELRRAVLSMSYLICATMFVAPPLAQFSGHLLHPTLDMWHPFHHGGTVFLTWQAMGWGAFTSACVVATVEWRQSTVVATATLLVLSQVAIHASIRAYRAPTSARAALAASTSSIDPGKIVIRNDLYVAAALSTLSLALRFVADLVYRSDPSFPLSTVVAASSVLWGVAVPLAQLARSDRSKALFRPFEGRVEYVALQAVGWSFFTLCAIVCIVLHVEMVGNIDAFKRRTSVYRFALTLQGALMQVPFVLIALSSVIDANTPHPNLRTIFKAVSDLSTDEAKVFRRKFEAAGLDTAAAKTALEALQKAAARECRSRCSTDHPIQNRNTTVAGIMVLCMCMACVVFAIAADFLKAWSSTQAIVFAVLCVGVSLGTCIGVHCGYGPVYHPVGYKRWMPFRGGVPFVTWQLCAGSSFSVGVTLYIFTLFSLYDSRGELHAVSGLLAAGVFCAAAPLLTFVSIFYFDVDAALSTVSQPGAFELHGEGIVSLLIFSGAWGFTSAYDLAEGTENWTLVAPPLLIGVLSFGVGLPLAAVALRKALKGVPTTVAGHPEGSPLIEISDEDYRPPTIPILRTLAMLAFCAVPVLAAVAAHYAYHSVAEYAAVAHRAVANTLLIALALLVLAIVAELEPRKMPKRVVDVIAACITFALYSSVFSQGIVTLLAVHFLPLSSSWVVAMNVVLLMGPYVTRVACNFVNVAYFGLQIANVALERIAFYEAAVASAVCLACMAYHRTYNPTVVTDASRYSQRVIAWAQRTWLWGLEHYFSVRIIHDGPPICGPEEDGGRQAVFGYHPHGVFPLTAVWMLSLDRWRDNVGTARRVTVHGASVIFSLPVVRDIALAFGSCEVTKKAIVRTLADGRSPLIVPGGQAEMLNTRFSDTRLLLTGHHKGFVRLAVQHKVALVPVFCFGEHNIMDNIHLPRMQRYFLDRFGFGYPVVAWGRWYLPLPCATPLTVVIGRAIDPCEVAPALRTEAEGTAAWNQGVDAVTKVYFDQLLSMIEAHKVEAGYPNLKVEVVYKK